VIEQQPRPGDVGLTSIAGPAGWAIRVGQWLNADGFSTWEHAFVVIGDGRLVEAEPGGARIAGLDEYAGRQVTYVAPAGLTDEDRTAICTAAMSFIDVPYSFLDYAAIAAHRLHLPVPGLRAYIESSGHALCSQLCDLIYQRAGIQLFNDGRWPGWVTPADLGRLLGGEPQ
jgi:hypothetical protein